MTVKERLAAVNVAQSGRNPFAASGSLRAEDLEKLLKVTHFSSPQTFIEAAEREGLAIWATDLSQDACALSATLHRHRQGERRRIALVFGREADGVSQVVLQAADERVYFEMNGFSDSLNVSSSVALVLDSMLA